MPTAKSIDFDRFRLRKFAELLEAEGQLERASGVPFSKVAETLDGNSKAVLFHNLPRCDHELVGGIMGSRERVALAFGVKPEKLGDEITARGHNAPDVIEVSREDAPVQAVVVEGDEIDLTKLPVHLQHSRDGGPYISAALDCSRDPDTGRPNTGVRRLMLRSKNTTGIDLTITSDLRRMYLESVARGERFPLSVAIGTHPADIISAGMSLLGDELERMSSYRGGTLPVVKSLTSEIMVPADAEWVLEGYLGAEGHVESEGPYGEFFGYYGPIKQNPVFTVTTISRRRDALFQTILFSGRKIQFTEGVGYANALTEGALWRAVKTAVRQPIAVHLTLSSIGVGTARIAIRQREAGDARNAIAAAFATGIIKNVYVVDEDIDITSDAEMDWAMATRFQPHRDIVIQEGFRTSTLDPSLHGAVTGSKAGFDLTFPFGELDRIDYIPAQTPSFTGPRYNSLREALANGPKSFDELAASAGSDDGREIVLALDALRREGILDRENRSGRYRLVT